MGRMRWVGEKKIGALHTLIMEDGKGVRSLPTHSTAVTSRLANFPDVNSNLKLWRCFSLCTLEATYE